MKTDNVFFVGFDENETTILHSKCGSEALIEALMVEVSVNGQKGVGFSCPICDFETMYFLKAAWDQVLEKLKKSPEKTKMIVQKCYTVDKIVLYSGEAIVLEKRTLV